MKGRIKKLLGQAEKLKNKRVILIIGGVLPVLMVIFAARFLPLAEFAVKISSLGRLGALVICLTIALGVVLPPLPQRVLILLCGTIYGVFDGFLIAFFGQLLGASVSFFIARRILAKRITHRHADSLARKIDTFQKLLVLRLLVGSTFDVASYLAGYSKIKFKDFVAATALGLIPGVMIDVSAGATFLEKPLLSAAFIVAVALVGLSYGRKRFYEAISQSPIKLKSGLS